MRKPKKHPKPIDRYANFERKAFAVGDTVALAFEVNGRAKGTKCTVVGTQFEGAVFAVRFLDGTDVRVKASDLI